MAALDWRFNDNKGGRYLIEETILGYRECNVEIADGEKRKACFHQWTTDGGAIVEFEDGTCGCYPTWQITFKSPITFDFEE